MEKHSNRRLNNHFFIHILLLFSMQTLASMEQHPKKQHRRLHKIRPRRDATSTLPKVRSKRKTSSQRKLMPFYDVKKDTINVSHIFHHPQATDFLYKYRYAHHLICDHPPEFTTKNRTILERRLGRLRQDLEKNFEILYEPLKTIHQALVKHRIDVPIDQTIQTELENHNLEPYMKLLIKLCDMNLVDGVNEERRAISFYFTRYYLAFGNYQRFLKKLQPDPRPPLTDYYTIIQSFYFLQSLSLRGWHITAQDIKDLFIACPKLAIIVVDANLQEAITSELGTFFEDSYPERTVKLAFKTDT